MIQELQSIHAPLTRELAESHASLPQIKGDRKLLTRRMRMLRTAMEGGLFYSPDWAVAFCKGKKYRINGKHSSHLLQEINGEFPTGLAVTIKQFNCDTEDELATLFDQFDRSGSLRSRSDSLNVHKALEAGLVDVATTNITVGLGGITCYYRETIGEKFSIEDQKQLVHQHADFLLFVSQYTGTARMKRHGIVAAIFATYSVGGESPAKSFWDAVRDQDHEDARHPTRVLGKFIEICMFNPIDNITRRQWPAKAYLAKCIHAWNAVQHGRTTDLKYHSAAPVPKPAKPPR